MADGPGGDGDAGDNPHRTAADNPGAGHASEPRRARATTGSARDWLAVYAKGVAMGAADTVPGVSGGTIALITGIYERLVSAIAALDAGLARDALGVADARGRQRLREALARADVAFLAVLGLGILTAVLTVSRGVGFALEAYRAPTNAFFFGLIAASAVVLYGEVALDTPRRWAAAALAAGFAFWLTGSTAGGDVSHAWPVIVGAGAVTSSAMLLPGISGAALLYVLGQYEYLIDALHGFVGALADLLAGGDPAAALATGTVVATFLAGVAVGLVTVAHAVRYALRRDRGTTLTVLVSLMVGALRLPAAEVLANTPRWTPAAAAAVAVAALAGAGIVLALDRYTDDLEYGVE